MDRYIGQYLMRLASKMNLRLCEIIMTIILNEAADAIQV